MVVIGRFQADATTGGRSIRTTSSVGRETLAACQYKLMHAAYCGSLTAQAVLADIVAWASRGNEDRP